MFILPSDLLFGESFTAFRRWRRISYLGDQISCRCLRNSVHEHADEWRLEHDGEGKGKAEKDTLTVAEPSSFLILVERDTRKIRVKL